MMEAKKTFAYVSEAWVPTSFGYKEEIIGENAQGPITALILEGEFQRSEAKNRNGRIYSDPLLLRETKKLQQFIAERNGLPMGLDHPLPGDDEKSMVLIQRMGMGDAASLCIQLEMENRIVFGKHKIITGDHGAGDKLAALVLAGFKPGVSSRGLGGKPMLINGSIYVPEDYTMITYDNVSQPSTFNAIMERRFNEEIQWLESEIKNNKKTKIWDVLTNLSGKYGELK